MKVKPVHHQAAQKVFNFIQSNNHYLLSAHIGADGDAIAAVIAMGLLLKKMGKSYSMVLHDQNIDSRFNYLRDFDQIRSYSRRFKPNIQAAIILDVPGLKRLGDVVKLLPERSKIAKIDHHPVEDDFADVAMVDVGASSATQLVYEIIEVAGIDIDPDMANAIYTGIVYDTGRFSFSNTSSRDMYICGRMVEIGVKPSKINDRIFFENSFEAIRTIGKGLANMEHYLDGEVIVIYLDHETMKRNHQGETEELANYSVAIRGGKIGIFMREVKPGFHKISLRSKDDVDVNKIARKFDGGGHSRAAGCRIDGSKEEVLAQLLSEIEKQLK